MSAASTWNDVKTRVKKAFDDNPILFIGVSAGAIQATAKLIQANTERKNAKTWRHEVKRRERKDNTLK